MTKYSTTNISTKGSMLMREEPRSPLAVAAGAVWAKAEDINTENSPIRGNRALYADGYWRLVSKGVAVGRSGLTLGHGFEVAPKPFRKSRPSHPPWGPFLLVFRSQKGPQAVWLSRQEHGWRDAAISLGWLVEPAAINYINE